MRKSDRAGQIREFNRICQEHHLKVTPQRVAIYQEVLNSGTHPTADTIYQIREKGEKNE
jgi:Fur family peroxide stress response transcriptional regulator